LTGSVKYRILYWSALLLLGVSPLKTSAQTDSIVHYSIDSTVVSASRRTSPVSLQGTTKVDIGGLSTLPTIMGTADPLRFLRLLPSVQTGSEIDAGIHIQGCDHGHNIVTVDGMPVYGANHLLGIFSVFNPAHFQKMDYSTMAGDRGRLGGAVDMIPYRKIQEERVTGDLSAGLIAAQGNITAKTGERSMVSISGRKTFLNLLYGSFLEISGNPFKYGFGDVDLSWIWAPTKKDRIYADAFWSSDLADYGSAENQLSAVFSWWNAGGSLHWDRKTDFGADLRQQIWASTNSFHIDFGSDYIDAAAKSHTRSYGYRGNLRWKGLSAGSDLIFYDVMPQQVTKISGEMLDSSPSPSEVQNAFDATLHAGWTSEPLLYRWTFSVAADANWYLSPERRSFWSLTPSAGVKFNMFRGGTLHLRGGAANQNIFLTGITSLGFPVEFNLMAGKYGDPAKSLWTSLSYNLSFLHETYALSAELYYRRLYNQLEFSGSILDYVRPGMDLGNMLLSADGWNYGLNLILHKQSGKFTGWISYSLGRSLREDGQGNVWPSNFERIHELNAVATYSGGKWDIGGTFVAASGTPFTAPLATYVMVSRPVSDYGPRNGENLAPYIRLDLNFNWYFRNDPAVKHGVNVSIYNALGRDNEIAYKNFYDGDSFAYRPFSFAMKFMPGAGWFYKF